MLDQWLYPDLFIEAAEFLDKTTEKYVLCQCQEDFRKILFQSPIQTRPESYNKSRAPEEHEILKKRPIVMGLVPELPDKSSWPFV